MAAAVEDAISRRDGDAVLQLIDAEPSLLWLRNAPIGEYPLHQACQEVRHCQAGDICRDLRLRMLDRNSFLHRAKQQCASARAWRTWLQAWCAASQASSSSAAGYTNLPWQSRWSIAM